MMGDTLIKKPKPCGPDDYVHVVGHRGCFRVIQSKVMYFTIMKNREEIMIKWEYFICLKGQGQSAEAQLRRGIRSALRSIKDSSNSNAAVMGLLENRLKELRRN